VDGGGWQNVGKAISFDAPGGGWGNSRTLRVKAVTVVDGPAGSATSTAGADPNPGTTVRVKRADYNSCPGKPNVADRYYKDASGNAHCGDSDSNWVSFTDGWIDSPCWMNIYGSAEYPTNPASYYKWYRMNSGPHQGWYVKLDTIDVNPPDVGRC
jgi:hypothetical protein